MTEPSRETAKHLRRCFCVSVVPVVLVSFALFFHLCCSSYEFLCSSDLPFHSVFCFSVQNQRLTAVFLLSFLFVLPSFRLCSFCFASFFFLFQAPTISYQCVFAPFALSFCTCATLFLLCCFFCRKCWQGGSCSFSSSADHRFNHSIALCVNGSLCLCFLLFSLHFSCTVLLPLCFNTFFQCFAHHVLLLIGLALHAGRALFAVLRRIRRTEQ